MHGRGVGVKPRDQRHAHPERRAHGHKPPQVVQDQIVFNASLFAVNRPIYMFDVEEHRVQIGVEPFKNRPRCIAAGLNGGRDALAAGQSLLVTGAASVQWQAENSAGTSGLSLNNSGDLVELWRAPETGDPVLLDSATVPGHAAGSDRAYAWLTLAASWILYDGLNPYGGDLVPTGTGCVPSPGP